MMKTTLIGGLALIATVSAGCSIKNADDQNADAPAAASAPATAPDTVATAAPAAAPDAKGRIIPVSAQGVAPVGLTVRVKSVELGADATILDISASYGGTASGDVDLAFGQTFVRDEQGNKLMLKRIDDNQDLKIRAGQQMDGRLVFLGAALPAVAALLTMPACERAAAPLPSLKDQTGHFRVTDNAPRSSFAIAGTGGGTGTTMPDSSFGPAGGTGSDFRLAEVPADRLEETRTLLTRLGAREDAGHAIRFSLSADVLFDFDKASLRPDAAAPLAHAERLIAAYPQAPLGVVGHTDARGDDAYNDRLSLARARTVADRLAPGGDRRPTVTGRGEREPVAPNAFPDGRQRNRRVEIVLAPLPSTRGH